MKTNLCHRQSVVNCAFNGFVNNRQPSKEHMIGPLILSS